MGYARLIGVAGQTREQVVLCVQVEREARFGTLGFEFI